MHQSASRLSRRGFLGWFGGLVGVGLLGPSPADAAPSVSDTATILEQKPGLGSCGPCAVGNSFLHGDAPARRAFDALPGPDPAARLDALIARYGTRPSETYGPSRGRFAPGLGICTDDVPLLVNDLCTDAKLPPVHGQWLDALPAEADNQRAHLRRVHTTLRAALARGLPPILEVRAFTSNPTGSKEPWANFYAHWLALLAVEPAELPANASGFACRFADSFTGRIVPGFAYAERFRPFAATRGFGIGANGSKSWRWLNGHPYVLLQLPDVPMNLETAPPAARAVIALTYMVARG